VYFIFSLSKKANETGSKMRSAFFRKAQRACGKEIPLKRQNIALYKLLNFFFQLPDSLAFTNLALAQTMPKNALTFLSKLTSSPIIFWTRALENCLKYGLHTTDPS
jgi:hypothetical protein